MTVIDNRTPFSASVFASFDAFAREQLILVVAASFTVDAHGQTHISDEQYDVSAVDTHHGDPANSSVHVPGQLAFSKAQTDIVVTGHAHAPVGRQVKSMEISLEVADVAKTLLVRGDRCWRQGALGKQASSPKPFERIPILYERAFGGGMSGRASSYEIRNPIGIGLDGLASSHESVKSEVPNIEYPDDQQEFLSDHPKPAGFGALAPHWKPRVDFAGTYDDVWLREQAPLLPHDFDLRFFQFAPEDQRSSKLRVGDRVRLVGMTPEGVWQFEIPRANVPVSLLYANQLKRASLSLDSIHIEPDVRRVSLIGRLTVEVRRNAAPLFGFVIGTPSPGWARARSAAKEYRPDKGKTL